jgi:hypothetical protein
LSKLINGVKLEKIMSNILKSKVLLGAMILGAVFVGAMALAIVPAEASYTHTGLLKMGMTSSQVMSLQQTLNGGGFLVATTGAGSPGMESNYFGAKTKAAVMAFQSAKGLTVDGIVGAQSGTALAAMTGVSTSYPSGCTSTSGFSTTTGLSCSSTGSYPAGCTSTSGYSSTTGAKCDSSTTETPSTSTGTDEGELKNFDSVSADENSFSEDEEVELYAFEMEADGSDMMVSRVDIYMGQTTTAESNNADDYFDSAALLVDGEEVANLDVSDWDEEDYDQTADTDNDEFRLRFATDFTVDDGDTAKLTVVFTTANNIDTADSDNATWQIDLATDSVRAEDEAGFSDEYGSSNEVTVAVDEVTSGDLDVSLNSENPDAQAVEVDATDDTNGVEVLAFDLEANDGDVDVTDIRVTIDDVGTLTDVDSVVNTLHLFMNGDEIASESVPATAGQTEVITFDVDGDVLIEDGDTAEFTVEADINNLDGGDFDGGDGIVLSFTSLDAEDEAGDNVEADGTAVGENFSFFVDGIAAKFVSATAVATPSGVATVDDNGTFTIVFDVTAFGSDVYVDATAIADETGGIAPGYQDIDASTTSVAAGVIDCSGCDTAANTTLKVSEGTTERFTVTIAGSGADVFASASLTSILYALTPIAGDTLYAVDMGDFKTTSVWLDSN